MTTQTTTIIRTMALALVLLLGIQNVKAQEPTYKGLWGRVETEQGLGFSLSQLPKGFSDHGAYFRSFAFTVGYHFNSQWSVGVGNTPVVHLTPQNFGYLGMFIEGSYRPFEGRLAPMAFHLRTIFPVVNTLRFQAKPNASISVGWACRNRLWNMLGAEVSVGLNYLPYSAKEIISLIGSLEHTEETHHLNKIGAFLRLAITVN